MGLEPGPGDKCEEQYMVLLVKYVYLSENPGEINQLFVNFLHICNLIGDKLYYRLFIWNCSTGSQKTTLFKNLLPGKILVNKIDINFIVS